jgi:hypothetical protein
MFSLTSRFTRLSASLLLTSVLALGATMPAFAGSDPIVQTLTAGSLTTSLTSLILPSLTYSNSAQNADGSMTLNADDTTGTAAGWNVTIIASAFVYSGPNAGTNIPAVNFSLISAAMPVSMAGQVVDVSSGPIVPLTSPLTTLDTARKVIQAQPAFGNGTYTQALGVRLIVPAQSRVGTYTSTLTTSIISAP